MRRDAVAGSIALALLVAGAGVTPAFAASASIAPSHLKAGKTTQVSVTASACSSYDIQLSGGILKGPADLIDSGRKQGGPASHHFKGQVEVKGSALKGTHTLSIRCGGGLYGSVKVTVGQGQSGGSKGSGGDLAKLTLQLGGTYATSAGAADGEKVHGQITIGWEACKKAGGKTVTFANHSGIYNSDGHGYDNGAEFALKGGKFKDGHGVYVSPLLKVGSPTEKLTCKSEFDLALLHGKIKVKLTRKVLTSYRSKDSPPEVFQQVRPGFNGFDDHGQGSPVIVSVPACRDPKALLTMDSPGLSPNTLTAQNHNIGVTDFESWETRFSFRQETAVDTPGDYPVTLSCGSGVVAKGVLRVSAD